MEEERRETTERQKCSEHQCSGWDEPGSNSTGPHGDLQKGGAILVARVLEKVRLSRHEF